MFLIHPVRPHSRALFCVCQLRSIIEPSVAPNDVHTEVYRKLTPGYIRDMDFTSIRGDSP